MTQGVRIGGRRRRCSSGIVHLWRPRCEPEDSAKWTVVFSLFRRGKEQTCSLALRSPVLIDHFAANLSAVATQRVALPTPTEGNVLVNVSASSVNPIDWKVCDGSLQTAFPFTLPHILASR